MLFTLTSSIKVAIGFKYLVSYLVFYDYLGGVAGDCMICKYLFSLVLGVVVTCGTIPWSLNLVVFDPRNKDYII